MLKQILCTVLCLVLFLSVCIPVTAQADREEFRYTVIEGEVTVWGYSSKNVTALTIPDKIQGYPVTVIDNHAFSEYENLQSITLPGSLKKLGIGVFYGCTSLTEAVIPDSVTQMEDSVFCGCSSLERVVLSQNLTALSDYMFYGCTRLSALTLPRGLTEIGDFVFGECKQLNRVSFGAALRSIGNNTFFLSYVDTVTIDPQNPVYFSQDGVIFNKDKTVLVRFPTTKEGHYDIPEGVQKIEENAFSYCFGLLTVTIPHGVTAIGNGAFYHCGLTAVTLPDSVTALGTGVFEDCLFLETAVLPSQIRRIPARMFAFCHRLRELVLPDTVSAIQEAAFSGCKALTEIVIPSSVTAIGPYAFHYCSGLQSAVLSDALTEIETYAFANCISLTRMVIPPAVTAIGRSAFDGCANLQQVTLPLGLEVIQGNAFANCAQLQRVALPSGRTQIHEYALGYTYERENLYRVNYSKMEDFTLYGCWDSTAEYYALRHGFSFVCEKTVYTDPATQAKVGLAQEDPANGGTFSVTVSPVSESEISYLLGYSKDGAQAEPTESITVHLPVPEGFFPRWCKIVCMEEDGSQTDMNADYVERSGMPAHFTFTAHRFGEYRILQMPVPFLYGDPSGDGIINAQDALQTLQYSVGVRPFTPEQQDKADVNGDAAINAADALYILKRAIGKIQAFPVESSRTVLA